MTPPTSAAAVLAGRYRLGERIASGGVGQVWRGMDLVLKRPVAVKLLLAEYVGNPETRARFRLEARSAACLSHPNIAQVYDYGDANAPEVPFLVMELVDGPSLAQVLAAGRLHPARAMDVVAQVAAGLDAAHAAGVIHRDIKPANLLLSTDGRVKITDFGIAEAASAAPASVTGAIPGTPAYLAPERAAGAPAAPACDLYSLGVVGYECLAGAPPFRGDPAEVAAAHQHDPLPPLPADVPSPAAALIAELTAKDPGARPATAAEVGQRAGRLHAVTSHDPAPAILAWPASPPARPADAESVTLADFPPLGTPSASRGRWRGSERPYRARRVRPWAGRTVALTVAASCAAAGLAGWLAATVTLAADPRAAAGRSAGAAPAPMVMVSSSAVAGRPASSVLRQLRQLGLHPRLVQVPAAGKVPGTVISVWPAGRLPAGTSVVVTAASLLPRQGGDGSPGGGGHGGGDGGGDGPGGGGHGH